MKRWILFLSLATCILVSGCAHSGWKRQDGVKVTYSNFIEDHRQCYFSIQIRPGLKMIPFFGDVYGMTVQQEEKKRYEKCLQEKGYYKGEDR
jgi:hypothetical protein